MRSADANAVKYVGKIFEMRDGTYQPYSFLSHRGLGLEYLTEFKGLIEADYDEEFYYMVCSVVLQHHGEYGEFPKTLCAMLVHFIDETEANLTGINDTLENDAIAVDTSGAKIKFNDMYLNIPSVRK